MNQEVLNFNPRFPIPSDEVQRRLFLSMVAAISVETREMKCPICGFKVAEIPVTQTEVIFVKCHKCKFQGPLHPAYFRRMKRHHAYTGPYKKRSMKR